MKSGTAFVVLAEWYVPVLNAMSSYFTNSQKFEPVLALFALILLFSSYKLLTAKDEDEDEDLSDNAIVNFCKKVVKGDFHSWN